MGCGGSKSDVPVLNDLKETGQFLAWIDKHADRVSFRQLQLTPAKADSELLANAEQPLLQSGQGPKIVGASVGKHISGGFMGETNMCTLNLDNGTTMTAFLKLNKDNMLNNYIAKKLKTYREVLFFEYMRENDIKLQHCRFPMIYLGVVDRESGRQIMIMEYIEGSEMVMKAFGAWEYKQRPNLERPIDMSGDKVTAFELSLKVAKAFGEFHSKFWMNRDFMDKNRDWVHRGDMFANQNIDYYNGLISKQGSGLKLQQKGAFRGTVHLDWDPALTALVNATYEKTTVESWRAHYLNEDFRWTLQHGDSHPGNFIWDPKNKEIVMIDMELCAFGNGPAELAVFLILRSDPAWRRRHEKELVEAYYETLVTSDSQGRVTRENYPLERCWQDYARDGFSRLAFYLAKIFPNFGMHVAVDMQKSMVAFMQDHNITAQNVAPITA